MSSGVVHSNEARFTSRLIGKLRTISRSRQFRDFITITILVAGVLVGLETYPGLMESYGATVHFIDSLIIGIFVVEITIRLGKSRLPVNQNQGYEAQAYSAPKISVLCKI